MTDEFIPAERILELIDSVAEMSEVSDIMQDDAVNEALAYIIKLMNNPNLPSALAAPLVVKLTALSVAFNLKAKTYQFRDARDKTATHKKNYYYSLSEGVEKIAAALKYIVRN